MTHPALSRLLPMSALAVAGCLALGVAPAHAAAKPAFGSTGSARVFEVNPVQ